jgi:hypothetical protein
MVPLYAFCMHIACASVQGCSGRFQSC